MEGLGGSVGGSAERTVLRRLIAAAFATLALLMFAVFAHAATSYGELVPVVQALSILLAALALASTLGGVHYAWRAFPQHRRAVVFLVTITSATLLAHAYVIGSPGASAGGSVSGMVGTTFGDDKISVASSVAGQAVNVSVTATGGAAIAGLHVTVDGSTLSGGFGQTPTFSSPIQPGTSAAGTWVIAGAAPSARLTVSYQALSCYSTSSKNYGCIMDEVFYVPEAMGVLSGQHCSTAGTNCHMEHPYLAPTLIAAGMAVFGQYDVVGWRLMPALLGSFSIPLLFGIAWRVSGSKKVAYFSASLLALDVMFFSQSGGALLDVPEVFFGLAAFFAYFAGLRVWRFDRYVVAGVLLGVAGLAKETAVFIAMALLTYIVLFDGGSRGSRVYSALKVTVVVGLVFAAGLQAYDSTLATPAVPTFVQHVSYILTYGSSLTANKLACQPTTGYWCKFAEDPGGAPILPTDWLVYYSPVAYYATSVSVCPNTVNGVCKGGSYSYVATAYYGVTNLLETWTVFIWVPLMGYALYRQFRKRGTSLEQFGFGAAAEESADPTGETKFMGFTLILFLWSYLPYLFLLVAGRVTYPFYFLPAVPAVAMGCTYWLTRSWFPKWLVAVYMAMVFVFFFVYFPEKGFLPDWLRVLIGH